jgi:hypothetical protein
VQAKLEEIKQKEWRELAAGVCDAELALFAQSNKITWGEPVSEPWCPVDQVKIQPNGGAS